MVNVLFALINDQFSVTAPNSYVVNDDEGTRILFIVGMANAMVIKLQEAY